MTEWNKALWALMILSLSTVINVLLRKINNKKVDTVVGILAAVGMLAVSICWVYFDFWK